MQKKEKYPELVLFGKQLRTLRKALGFSQESFAHAVGIHPRYYSAIERGEVNAATRNLIKIAYVLNLEIGELFPSLKKLARAAKL